MYYNVYIRVQDLLGDFLCLCVDGWDPPTCAVPTDECQNHFCQNGATCVVRSNPTMDTIQPWILYNHGYYTTMDTIQPWILYNHGYYTTMDTIQPWILYNHGYYTTMDTIQPWILYNHGYYTTMDTIQPWILYNHGYYTTMDTIQPWILYNHGYYTGCTSSPLLYIYLYSFLLVCRTRLMHSPAPVLLAGLEISVPMTLTSALSTPVRTEERAL